MNNTSTEKYLLENLAHTDLNMHLNLYGAKIWWILLEEQSQLPPLKLTNSTELKSYSPFHCVISGCTRPPQSQSGAIFSHQNDHYVVFKSARQFWKNVTGRYEKYASDHAFGTLLANKLAYLWFFLNEGISQIFLELVIFLICLPTKNKIEWYILIL